MKEVKDKKINDIIIMTSIICCCVLVLILLFPIIFIKEKFEIFGNYGGFVGGILGSILSFVTVILVYKTYTLQEEELKETHGQLKKQQFETVFFNMLGMIHTLGKEFQSVDGTNFFISFMESLRLNYQSTSSTNVGNSDYHKIIQELDEKHKLQLFKEDSEHRNISTDLVPDGRELFNKWRASNIKNEEEYVGLLYLQFFYSNNSELGHFFRYIHNTIKYCIDERKPYEDEIKYINLIQSQLTNYQLLVLFYNCISSISLSRDGKPEIKTWLDEYEIFKNLPPQILIRPTHQDFYPNTNFKQKHADYKWSEDDHRKLSHREIMRRLFE